MPHHLLDQESKVHKFIKTVVIIIGLMGLSLATIIAIETSAEKKAREFCTGFPIGSPIKAAQLRAQGLGNDRLRILETDKVTVGFTGFTFFSRHLCIIKGEDSNITSKRYLYLD